MTIWKVTFEYTSGGKDHKGEKFILTWCPLGSEVFGRAAEVIIGDYGTHQNLHDKWQFILTSVQRIGDCDAPELPDADGPSRADGGGGDES